MAPMRRKSHGSIRSPHVKRDSQSQVIIEGWLYKLEGAALKQFKQRWCVLADFCLFFYKGPSEEKTTSSILLPSYKISPCTSDDKVSKKFSFKAEHQNMKTYYFAAEDIEGMKKWMNAMSLASIMQNFVRSEKYDATSQDDEDSGFTSYRSRRYTSQKLNSTYDSNFSNSEPLKQRSNSYGDRMGEVYLSSDDKYPNDKYYKPCQNEPPRRQPLYANAPPKPRRLTQSDSYGLYPKDCYDPEIAAIEASQYYGKPSDRYYPEQYYPGTNQDSYPDLYRSQPTRPRSADFLERDAENVAIPDVAIYPERRQPQRPKSSLEYYDRYADGEDANFDYYREALRIQSDNLYANKNIRKHGRPQMKVPYDHRVNVNYMGNNNGYDGANCYNEEANLSYNKEVSHGYNNEASLGYTEDVNHGYIEEVSPCYGQIPKDKCDDVNISMSSSQFSSYAKPQKPKEESMQRLLEWKQRMLQSPLTKRNHSSNSSPISSPVKADRQKIGENPYPPRAVDYVANARSHSASPQRHTDNRRRNESSSSQRQYEVKSPSFSNIENPKFSNIENPKFSPKIPEPSLNSSVDISVDNLYKENVMYCVDSENNEILFSYDDVSPTTGIPKSHYPPQMHSFTTMPNVSNIGSDNSGYGKYENKDYANRQEETHSLPRSGQEYKGSSSIPRSHRRTTYSSDDEDEDEMRDHENKLNSLEKEQRMQGSFEKERRMMSPHEKEEKLQHSFEKEQRMLSPLGKEQRMMSPLEKEQRMMSPLEKEQRLHSSFEKEPRLQSSFEKEQRKMSPLQKEPRVQSSFKKEQRMMSPLEKERWQNSSVNEQRMMSPPEKGRLQDSFENKHIKMESEQSLYNSFENEQIMMSSLEKEQRLHPSFEKERTTGLLVKEKRWQNSPNKDQVRMSPLGKERVQSFEREQQMMSPIEKDTRMTSPLEREHRLHNSFDKEQRLTNSFERGHRKMNSLDDEQRIEYVCEKEQRMINPVEKEKPMKVYFENEQRSLYSYENEQLMNESDLVYEEDFANSDRYHTSSPDYVNIGAICNDYVPPQIASGDCSKINRAVLKPLDTVSKKGKVLPDLEDIPPYEPAKTDPCFSVDSKRSQQDNMYHAETSSMHDSLQNQSFTSYSSKGGYESETEFDIKREDYYRASQIFYASTRVKNKQTMAKRQKEWNRGASVQSENRSRNYTNAVLSDSMSSIDKDVGLPLPNSPYKSTKKEPDVVEVRSPPKLYSKRRYEEPIESQTYQSEASSINVSRLNNDKLDKTDSSFIDYRSESKGDSEKDVYAKQHNEKPDVEVPSLTQEAGKKLSYEEMRGQLLRKREAPPPNIVQDRIKKFETVDPMPKESKNKSMEHSPKIALSSDNIPAKEMAPMRNVRKKSRHKPSRSKSYRRALHSDSEAVQFRNSDSDDYSSDDLTMKSAPILLSPLSSVLADLRITAEKEKSPTKVESINKMAIKEYSSEGHVEKINVADAQSPTSRPSKSADKFHKYEECRRVTNEAEYLPMFGSKNSTENEPEYVMMGGAKSPGIKNKKFFVEEEHVYNEPFCPPPSFLHDVYEKQKTKQFQYLKSSSSEDSLTENIYEKPIHRFPSGRNFRNEYSHKSVQETNSVLMSSLSCSNVTSVGRGNDLPMGRYVSERNIPSRSNLHHYEQANLSVSVPDLLQLQDLKDSDASDADDEASRDFDTIGELRQPSYQSPILDHCAEGLSSEIQQKQASFELDLMPFNRKEPKLDTKPLPTYEALYNVATFPQQPNAQSTLKSGEKFQMQKLRVYTKGKKPEAPKIFPVPFDLEESEICKILERKDSTKNLKLEDSGSVPPSLDSSIAVDSDSFSENVAYATRGDITPIVSPQLAHAYRPDVVPTVVQEVEKVPSEKNSPSKSPNSAPYYYSDLYSGQGINMVGQQIPLFKRTDVPYVEKTSPPKTNTALLNNVRSRSPASSCKGDIGRKVNKINSKSPAIAETKDALNEKMKYWKAEAAKNNLKSSIDILESSKSKYLDAEKNKYEAGHTLEKTRSSSTMSYFKHRASTPDLNTCQYQSDEPVYENIVFQPKPKLQKRLSHSLERLPNVTRDISEEPSSPVYENIEFFNAEMRFQEIAPTPPIKKPPMSIEPGEQITTSRNVVTQRQFCDAVVKPIKTDHHISNDEAGFLDQNVLRRVSEQHFFGKNFKQPQTPKIVSESKNLASPLKLEAKEYKSPPTSESLHLSEVKDHKMDVSKDSSAVKLYRSHMTETYDTDSSGTSTSGDEASVDSDNRHYLANNKFRSSEITRSVSSDIHIGETNHLKKLVQQSEGLMCKGKRLSVSAGDLLGKTHEELVLLLIQLRRNQAKILKAKDKLELQMKNLQEFNQPNIGKYGGFQSKRELQRQITLLETQYNVTQPLVTLVDNMIKLGSLYGSSNRRSFSLPALDTSQEDLSAQSKAALSPVHFGESSILTKLLADETSFQKRISEIYSLDKGLRHETNSITSLHQDKEMLEFTLSGMRSKILDHQDRPSELQKLKKQQKMIEKELVRVKRLLSSSAKKIEDAASKNDQMEKDILYLRQILKEALKTGSSETKSSQQNRADIEAELSRVQNVLDELANHRHEINNTVLKLKGETPPTVSREVGEFRASPSGMEDDKEATHLKKVKKGGEVRASPTGVAGSAPLPVRKKQHSMYLETDLDTMCTRDLANLHERELEDIPVYVNAEDINNPCEEIYENLSTFDSSIVPYSQTDASFSDPCSMQDINDADERMKRFYGILPKEKPFEIKTVRIVKRQSERRNRERDKKRVTYDDQSSVWVVDEPDLSSDDLLEIEEVTQKVNPPVATRPSSINFLTSSLNRQSNSQSAHERLFGSGAIKTEKSSSTSSQSRAYATKRTKRRHYTVSGYQYVLDPQFAQYFKDRPRSRDDVDMERCLRTANTPDIVRSTIKKNDVFDDRIIERELMLPPKIEIPERYVEIEPDQLSAREKLQRSIKAENICKMLSETTTTYETEERSKSPEALHKKLSEEKRKRAHLLNLNRAIAQEVVKKSKAVAVFATLEHMLKKPLTPVEEDLSPMAPFPITQQRYNFLT